MEVFSIRLVARPASKGYKTVTHEGHDKGEEKSDQYEVNVDHLIDRICLGASS
jgi:hypothetical protein